MNKNKIKAKALSVYIETFKAQNAQIDESMKTHPIGSLEELDILENNTKFFEMRIKAISEELNDKIIPQKSDDPLERYKDIEEPEEAENSLL